MSKKQLVLSGKDFIKLLEKMGFAIVRINGSHHRLKHEDGRVTTIPVHKNDDLPKGLMRKIIRENLKLDLEDFEKLVEKI
jgi:predicted RNA binding protein YcfA (HicA-like mRNA interferase family)